jgi:Flp pilus assembly protein TadB
MANEPLPDDLRELWRQQPLENIAMALEDIRARAARFERRINRRNIREYFAGLIGAAIYAYYIWKFPNAFMRAGSAMIIAGVLFVMWRLYRHGRVARLPQDLGLNASLDFHRRHLVRQRDLLRSVFWWYLLPMVPGLLVFLKGSLGARGFQFRQTPFLGMIVGFFVWIWWINQRAAKRLDRQIAELDRLENQP